MTKHDMAITVFMALHNTTKERAIHNAEKNHGDYLGLMKNSKSHLEEMYVQAQNILMKRV